MKKKITSLLVGSMLVGITSSVLALDGPVHIPPLGVSVSDSDPGGPDDQEQWGRDGGRTLEFTVYQESEYDQLKWRPVDVGLAFDGEIDTAGETLTVDSIGVGSAIWTGETTVEVLDEYTDTYDNVTVNTQFVLTVKDASDSLVSFEIMDGLPTVDVKASTPAVFTATLEMRAQMPPYDSVTAICPYAAPTVGEYLPALDVFDCLQTNPAYDRPAITRFEYGFFYEVSFSFIELSEHDAHMEELVGDVQASVDNVYMWTNFLYTDWPLRMGGINTAHAQINDNLAIVGATLGQINTKVDNTCTQSEQQNVIDKLDDIKDGVKQIPDYNLLMFGLEDFIQDENLKPYVPAVIANSPLYQRLDDMNETLTQVNDNTIANAQGISVALAQCQQNAQALTQISSQMAQCTEITASLTTQLQEANETIADLNAAMASMYTQEELGQAIADACPGNSEYAGGGG